MTLTFAGLRSTHRRTQRTRAIVLHTTGGIRPPEGVYATLRSRKGPKTPDGLSVHHIVGADGSWLHTAPHDLVCLHASGVSEWTVGIELCSPLIAGTALSEVERARGIHREEYRDRVRGKRVLRLVDLTAVQTAATVELVEALCVTLQLPMRVPTEGGELMRRRMTAAELDDFEGVLGHYMCSATKIDPGTRVLEKLRKRWAC